MPLNGSPRPQHLAARGIANGLFNAYVFPFELVSFVLLSAMVGAIVLARREND